MYLNPVLDIFGVIIWRVLQTLIVNHAATVDIERNLVTVFFGCVTNNIVLWQHSLGTEIKRQESSGGCYKVIHV